MVDGETGRLAEVGGETVLVVAVIELQGTNELRRDMSDETRRRCLERFRIEAVAQRYEELFEVIRTRDSRSRDRRAA